MDFRRLQNESLILLLIIFLFLIKDQGKKTINYCKFLVLLKWGTPCAIRKMAKTSQQRDRKERRDRRNMLTKVINTNQSQFRLNTRIPLRKMKILHLMINSKCNRWVLNSIKIHYLHFRRLKMKIIGRSSRRI